GALAPPVERGAEQGELLGQAADADPEDQAPARHPVERAVAFGQRQRMVVAEDDDVGRETDLLGARGHVAERDEGVPVRRTPHLGDPPGDADVLAARQVVEAEAVGGPGDEATSSMPASTSQRAWAPGSRVRTGVTRPSLKTPET